MMGMFLHWTRKISQDLSSVFLKSHIWSISLICGSQNLYSWFRSLGKLWRRGFSAPYISGTRSFMLGATHTFSQRKKRTQTPLSKSEQDSSSGMSPVSYGRQVLIQTSTSIIAQSNLNPSTARSLEYLKAGIRFGQKVRLEFYQTNALSRENSQEPGKLSNHASIKAQGSPGFQVQIRDIFRS